MLTEENHDFTRKAFQINGIQFNFIGEIDLKKAVLELNLEYSKYYL